MFFVKGWPECRSAGILALVKERINVSQPEGMLKGLKNY